MKTIEIIIDDKGNTRLQTHGFAGGECRAASSDLEKALGEFAGEQLTSEFYHTPQVVGQREQQRQ